MRAWKVLLTTALFGVMIIASSGGALAALLGVQGKLQNPLIAAAFVGTDTLKYTASTGLLSITTTPTSIQMVSGTAPISIAAPKSLTIQALLDNSGTLVGGASTDGNDLIITGTVTINGTSYHGNLLTGNIIGFGFKETGATDTFDFKFALTGGSLRDAGIYAGIVGITMTSERSTFTGSFSSNFLGYPKCTTGVYPVPDLSIDQKCSDALGQNKPISFTATLTNTGNEKLSGFSCSNDQNVTLANVPSDLLPGASATVTGSYTPSSSPSTFNLTCSGTGAISVQTVSKSSSASCSILQPAISVTENCSNAPTPDQPIVFTVTVNNAGNETLSGVSCSDSQGPLNFPTSLIKGQSATVTLNVTPNVSPFGDAVTCNATGAASAIAVSANHGATCTVVTAPSLKVEEKCLDAAAPGQPITISGVITNTGNEMLSGFSCTDSRGAVLAGVPATLAPGATAVLTGSYIPTASGSTNAITCSASGAINSAPVSANSSSTCNIVTNPALTVAGSCSNASAPGQPINISAVITNTGNETLTGFSCTDSKGALLSGVPATLASGATASLTGSYVPTVSGSSDTITCSASGAINSAPVSANSSSTCNIVTNPALTVAGSCSNASAPGQPINISAIITNTGNETLTGFSCTDSKGALLSGVPATLASGATASLTGSYVPRITGSTDTITCSASGAINSAPVSANSSSTCNIVTNPAFTVAESCSNATAPGQPIGISAVITNTGNETLTGFSCSDAHGAALTGVPLTLDPHATATLTGNYLPAGSPATDTITCSASGELSHTSLSTQSSATCTIEPAACIQIKKQVSTNCTVTGGRDKHCKTDESKEDHCKRGDCDKGYCRDTSQSKQSYCREVTRKQAHCGSSEAKSTHCSKSDCDRGYCDRDESKDDYCKVPAAPVCVPVWLDADTQDTAATMNGATGSSSDSGDDLLTKLASGTYSNNQSSSWLQKLRHTISDEDSDEGEVRDADRDDDGDKSDDDDRYESAENYQGHVRQSGLMYRFTVSNCGSTELTDVVIKDPNIAIANYLVGSLKPQETRTLTSDQIPQLAQPKFSCSASFVNTATVTGTDFLGRTVSASDDAWVLCNTKTCAFTQGYWKNHPGSWPVTALKLGSASYTQNQLLAIFDTPPAGNGLISLAHQLIAAKLNAANGTMVPTAVQQAIHDADALTGALVVPPIGSGVLAPAVTSALIQTLDSYNSGTIAGGPTHCGDTPPTQLCTGIIGDFVWNDLNKNGLQNSGEPGLSGVKVTLSNGRTTTTDASGHYQFTGLCKGSYQVKVTPPCNLVATTGTSVSVNLTADSSSNLSADFGFAKPALSCTGKIGDFVWDDVNKNGIQDSAEAGLSGVQLTLSNGAATVTDASGHYQFTGLCAGDYQVTVATPAGYTASDVTQGSNPAKDSKGSPAKVTLNTNSSSVLNIDFGFYKTTAPVCTGVIGNFIWNDLNKNGIQDCTEKGIAGVVVKLNNVQTAITDADGHYQFGGLCSGSYTVTATTPDGFTPSLSLQGSSRAADSNGSPASVTLGDNRGSDLSVDFGFWKLPSPPATQAKGCSLGYWKNHTVSWPSDYHTSDNFDAIFGSSAFSPDISLLQALNSGGGGLSNLARQGTAALLNAQSPRITGFPLSVSEVKAAVKNAILTGNYDPLASKLDSYNNLGCPLN